MSTTLSRQRGFSFVETLIVLALLGIVLAIALPSLREAREQARKREARQQAGPLSECSPVDHGEGVWYFDCYGTTFADGLAQFRKTHPGLRITSVSGLGGPSRPWAAVVITEPKSLQ